MMRLIQNHNITNCTFVVGYFNNEQEIQPLSPVVEQPSEMQIKNFRQFLEKFDIQGEHSSQ